MELRRILSLSLVLASAACTGQERPAHAARAVGMLRAANEALRAYRAACDAYPETLEPLRGPLPAGQDATCARFGNLDPPVVDLVSAGLAPPPGEQYALVYLPARRTERGPQRYQIQARWLGRTPGEHWSFWTSDLGVLRIAQGRPANEDDRPIQ